MASETIDIVDRCATGRSFETNRVSREGDAHDRVTALVVNNAIITVELPWLETMYDGLFRELTQSTTIEPVSTARKVSHRVGLNVQQGRAMRHECHVDSNPIQALLYVTDHPRGSGGELAVSNRSNATGVSEVDEDCSVIYPVAGNLVVFDGRRFAHYVRPLTSPRCGASGRRHELLRAVLLRGHAVDRDHLMSRNREFVAKSSKEVSRNNEGRVVNQ